MHGLIACIVVYGFIKFYELGQTHTPQQIQIFNLIFLSASLVFIGGTVLGFVSLFQQGKILGTTYRDGLILGFQVFLI